MPVSELALVLAAEFAAAIVVAIVLFVMYRRLRQVQALVEKERQAREASVRHDRETGLALRATAEREALVLDHIDEVVFRLRPDGREWAVDFVSPRITDLLGHSPDEMRLLGAAPIHPDDLPEVLRQTSETFRDSGTRTFRYRIRHQNGTYRWFENRIRAVPPLGKDGPTILGVARDITEALAAEDALRQSREELQQASKMEALGRLAGGVAHDFNNLLTTMSGNAAMVVEQLEQGDARRDPLLEIISASERAQRFTRQLLAFSRKQVLETEPLDLGEVVTSMQAMLARLIGPDYQLEASIVGKMPQVEADRGQLEQVVMNLVVNARDAMPGGGVIHLRVRPSAGDAAEVVRGKGHRSYAVLEVEDRGIGIPRDLHQRIFEPFFTTKEKGRGTGLGLSMIYGFVRQSGGEIDLASSPEQGTCFRIYLPGGEATPQTAPSPAPAGHDAASDEPATVLVVDDEAGVRHLASAMLRRAGYAVVEARDGSDAQRVAESHDGKIDVLLTDIVMPGPRGPELADWLRTCRPGIRVIYMSGFRDTSELTDVDRGEALFLPKPFVRSALLGAIQRAAPAGTL